MSNTLQTIRPIQPPTNPSDWARVAADIQFNFNLVKLQCPQTVDELPGAGEVKFLAVDENGMWHTYSLIAGAGVTLTRDDSARTLTFTSP